MKLISSINNALKGLKYVWQNEHNFRLHISVSLVVLALGFYLNFIILQWIIITFCIILILSLEIVNSAIEYSWDHLEPNHHPVVGTIKDVMASSVFLASIGVSIIGILTIFYL